MRVAPLWGLIIARIHFYYTSTPSALSKETKNLSDYKLG